MDTMGSVGGAPQAPHGSRGHNGTGGARVRDAGGQTEQRGYVTAGRCGYACHPHRLGAGTRAQPAALYAPRTPYGLDRWCPRGWYAAVPAYTPVAGGGAAPPPRPRPPPPPPGGPPPPGFPPRLPRHDKISPIPHFPPGTLGSWSPSMTSGDRQYTLGV
jgi:hypothetical protein